MERARTNEQTTDGRDTQQGALLLVSTELESSLLSSSSTLLGGVLELLSVLADLGLLLRIGPSLVIVFSTDEIGLQDRIGFLVDVFILVRLQRFEVIQTTALVDDVGVLVEVLSIRRCRSIRLSNAQDVLDTFHRHHDDLRVRATEQVAQTRNHSLGGQVANLGVIAATGGVRDRPGCLFLKYRITKATQRAIM